MDGAGGNPGSGGFDPCECIVSMNLIQKKKKRKI